MKTKKIEPSDLPTLVTEQELLAHDASTTAHDDIRDLITAKQDKPANITFLSTGSQQLGSKSTASPVYLDFNTSGFIGNAYDARLLFVNGSANRLADCYFNANSFSWGRSSPQNQTAGQGDLALDNIWLNGANCGGIIYKNRDQMYGDRGNASTFSFIGNNDPARNPTAGVMGFLSPSEVATYGIYGETLLENVTFYIENRGSNPTYRIATVTYSATGCTFASQDVSKLKVGMYVSTTHNPRYCGKITAFNSTSITVADGWFQFGNTAAGQVPPNTAGIEINRQVKSYVLNTVAALDPSVQTAHVVNTEAGVFNMKGLPGSGSGDSYVGTVWGVHVSSLGQYPTSANFMSNGLNYVGYESAQSSEAGFMARSVTGSGNGFESRQSSNYAFVANPSNNGSVFDVNALSGALRVGKRSGGSTETPIDLFSGFASSIGARISADGGSASDLSSNVHILGGSLDLYSGNGVTSLRGGTTSGGWNGNHIALGGVTGLHIWANGKELRIKLGAPTSATDGTLIGTAP